MRELISTLNKIVQAGKESSNLPSKSSNLPTRSSNLPTRSSNPPSKSSNTRKKPLPSYTYRETYNVQRDIILKMMMMMITLMMTILLTLTLRRWIHAHSSSAFLPLSLPCQQNHAYKAGAGTDQDEIYLYGQMAFGTRQAWQLTDSSLTLMDHVAGKFATIYKATWRHDGKQETVAAKMLKGESSRIFFFFFLGGELTVLSHWDFSHGKFGSFSRRNASCDGIALPNLRCMLGVLVFP